MSTIDSQASLNSRIGTFNYYKELGATNNVVQYSRNSDATKNIETPSEDKQAIIKDKLGKWEKLFEQFESNSDTQSGSVKWGAVVDHNDYQGLQEATDELVQELNTKITDEDSAKAISKLLLMCSYRAETNQEELQKVQVKAFTAVSDVLSNLKGKINPDLRDSVLQLLNPITNNDFDAKAAKLQDLVDTAGPYDLVKRNSKTLANIQSAFDISIPNGSETVKYKDDDGYTIGDQVRLLIEMYKGPVLDRFTDIDGESNQLSAKGMKAFKGIRTDIVNAAMSQAQDTPSIMKKFQSANDKEPSSFTDGSMSYQDYAQERLTVTRNFYIEPTADNREALIKHFAKFAAELTKAQQSASITDAAIAAINNLKSDRKFNSIVVYPPELIKEEEAKESLKATAEMKVERISNLNDTKKTLTSLSAKNLLDAFTTNKSMGGGAANQASITNALRELISNKTQSFSDLGSFKQAIKDVTYANGGNKILVDGVTEETLGKIYDKAKELSTRDIDVLISKETKALKELLGLVNYSEASFDKDKVSEGLGTRLAQELSLSYTLVNINDPKAAVFNTAIRDLKIPDLFSGLKESLMNSVSDNTILNKDAFKAAIVASDLSDDVKGVIARLAPDDTQHITTKIINTAIGGLTIDDTSKTTLQNLINTNKKGADEDNSIDREALISDVENHLREAASTAHGKILTVISSESTPAAAIKALDTLTLTKGLSASIADIIQDHTITKTTSGGSELDCSDTAAVKNHIDAFDNHKASELIKKAGVDAYKIIKAGDSLSKYSNDLSKHSRTQRTQLNFLAGVESGLAQLFMENFTRSGIAGIATAVFGALEGTVINNGNLQSQELSEFTKREIDDLLKPHNATVQAYQASHIYIQAQQSKAYKEVLEKVQEKYAIGNGIDTEGQIKVILQDSSQDKSRIELFKELVDLVDTAHKITPQIAGFNISDEVKDIILKPDYKDASYREKQEIEVNKLLLKFVGALHTLSQAQINKINDSSSDDKVLSLQESLRKVRDLASNPQNNVHNAQDGAKKLEKYASEVQKVYGKLLEGETEAKELKMVDGIDALIDQSRELANVKIGGKKRFFDTGANFLRNFIAAIFTSTTNRNKENLSRLTTKINEDHGDGALSSNQNLTGAEEVIREMLVDPTAYTRHQIKAKVS
jgi:hypothetical protein